MKYYDKKGNEITKSTFYRNLDHNAPIQYSEGITGTGERYKRIY